MATPRLVVVSHRAPVEVTAEPDGRSVRRTVGGLATALNGAMQEHGGVWVAWAGTTVDEMLTPDDTGLAYPIRAVRLREREISNYYGGFANQVLWPLCHLFVDRCHFHTPFWLAYRVANERFAAAVHEGVHPRDLVWINDFHLCLVAGLLRAAGVRARMGVFWHIPFPPPAAFGILPWRAELLGGLLGADLLGFQTDADAANFLACVTRYLGLPVATDPSRVRLGDRDVRVAVLPVGVDAAHFRAQARDAAVRDEAARLRATLGADVVFIGVDRLDYTKGILERLLGFERFLERHPAWRRRVSLVQITVPSRFRVADYRELKGRIDETIGRIMGRFTHGGRAPVAYLYTALDHEALAAYYAAADVALVTPLRDGMNLVAKEYVACHPDGDGVLVLSEFAGAADELREAVVVNPYDPDTIRAGIDVAVNMAADERQRRMRALNAQVATHDVYWWTKTFLDLLAASA